MKIDVPLPCDIATHSDPDREALEALVIEGYRSGALSHFQSSQLLGLSRFQFDDFLKDRNIWENSYDIADLERDLEDLRRFEERQKAQ